MASGLPGVLEASLPRFRPGSPPVRQDSQGSDSRQCQRTTGRSGLDPTGLPTGGCSRCRTSATSTPASHSPSRSGRTFDTDAVAALEQIIPEPGRPPGFVRCENRPRYKPQHPPRLVPVLQDRHQLNQRVAVSQARPRDRCRRRGRGRSSDGGLRRPSPPRLGVRRGCRGRRGTPRRRRGNGRCHLRRHRGFGPLHHRSIPGLGSFADERNREEPRAEENA